MSSLRCAVAVMAFAGLLLVSGCAQQTQSRTAELNVTAVGPIAVVPFENSTANSQAGAILAELFQNELRGTGRAVVVSQDSVNQKLAALAGQTKPTEELGKLLGASALVVGRVTEYTYKTGLGEDPAVGVSVRLVDAKDGRVLWSGARSGTGHASWVKQDSLSRLAQETCGRLARAMVGLEGD